MLRRFLRASRQAASRVLADDTVFALVQRSIKTTHHVHRRYTRKVNRILSALNLPSRSDVERALDQAETSEARASELVDRMERLKQRE